MNIHPADLVLFAVALLAAFGVILGLALLLAFENKFTAHTATLFVPLMLLGVAVGTLMSRRRLEFAAFDPTLVNAEGADASSWPLRIVTALLVGLAGAMLIGRAARRTQPPPSPTQRLYWAYVSFFLGNNILNAVFGTVPAFSHNVIYPFLIFSAVFASRSDDVAQFVSFAKHALLAFMVGSLVVALVLPGLSLQPNYQGLIPGLSVRLWGLGSHSNSIGPMALVLLLLECCFPFRRVTMRWLSYTMALAVLVLAQSKTAWGACFVALSVLAIYQQYFKNRGRIPMGWTVAAVLGSALVLGILLTGPVESKLERFLASKAGSEALTLTGRNVVWQVAIAEWQSNPVFGYGPRLWDAEFRAKIGIPFAVSAHNQLLQSLAGAGAVGLITLLAYLLTLGAAAMRAAQRTHGLSVALFALMMLRGVTETPLMQGNLLVGDVAVHLFLFGLICVALNKPVATYGLGQNAPDPYPRRQGVVQ